MAGDWIKMGVALHDEPEVIALTVACNGIVDEDHAVGKLKRFWSWADQHLVDGNAPGVTKKWIDRYVGVTGFAAALESVGWLTVSGDGIAIPGFEVHMSQSAKRRAVTAKRVSKSRGKSASKCNAASVTKSVPRVEKEKEKEKLNSSSPTATEVAEKKLAVEEELLKRERNFIGLWNALEGVRKTRGSSLEGKRRGHLRARLATRGWPAECVEAFKRFPLKCFGPDGWKPDIEWILQPGNVNKILEGRYEFTKESGEPTPEPLDIAGALERTRGTDE